MNPTVTIDMDKKCAECGKRGAVANGLCLRCTTKALSGYPIDRGRGRVAGGGMSGWIGVDLDGTLAHYEGWRGAEKIGAPVPAMAERVRKWLAEGREVRIFTARAGVPEQVPFVHAWCERHFGIRLIVTDRKDFGMVELWDDRCVRVQANTGQPCCEFWRHVA